MPSCGARNRINLNIRALQTDAQHPEAIAPVPFTYGKAFLTFFKIGLFTIGGGAVMIPIIERDMVDRLRWLTREEFLDLMVVSQSAPGVFAANFAIAIGYKLAGKRGSFACAAGTVLPSIIIILAIALFFQQFRSNRVVENVFKGIRPAVAALIMGPIFKLSKSAGITWKTVWIPILSMILISFLGISPVWVIAAGIAGGIAKYFVEKRETSETLKEEKDIEKGKNILEKESREMKNRGSSESKAELAQTLPSRERGRAKEFLLKEYGEMGKEKNEEEKEEGGDA
ncbi:MAG: chromate transporter [Bacteroidaceae bacterium]|nr:chromate transporter [Bacteroidaceae bacterium]